MVKNCIPNTLTEALQFLATHNTKIISGGTDLMVQRKNWAGTPPIFNKEQLFIFNLQEMKYVNRIDNHLHIGATTPLSQILESNEIPVILKQAIDIIASPALRNMATIAGNIVNASPAGDTLPILYCLESLIVIESINSSRIVPIKEVITGPRRTTINSNEMITEIIIPLPEFTKSRFIKVGGRQADAISKVSFTGAVKIVENMITDLRVCFGAVGPTVIREKELEKKYQNITLNELRDNIMSIVNDYAKIIKPINDQRSNKEYRKQVALNLLTDFLKDI